MILVLAGVAGTGRRREIFFAAYASLRKSLFSNEK
jgi:hypothetical protein